MNDKQSRDTTGILSEKLHSDVELVGKKAVPSRKTIPSKPADNPNNDQSFEDFVKTTAERVRDYEGPATNLHRKMQSGGH